MTSLLSSIFSSTTALTVSRIDTMKAAEKALISFSHRFSWDTAGTNNYHQHQHDIELFDTPIPRSAIPLKNNGKQHHCLLFSSSCSADSQKDSKNDSSMDETISGPMDVTNIDSSKHLIIHGVQVTRKNNADHDDDAPLVLLHGYMNGALYFYRNLIGLADHCKTVYSLDMLGWGLSSRPPFQMDKDHPHYNYEPPLNSRSINYAHEKKLENDSNNKKEKETYKETHAAEQVFVESLEAWRKAHNIPKMKLAGHSMGGYMSVAYAEKYPERVERLILISPAGIPDDEQINVQARYQNASFMTKTMINIFSGLFNFGITPAGFLRNLPESRGRNMVSRYIQGRLPAIQSSDERQVLGEYLYTNAALPASGEDCLNKVLKPTTFARVPALYRIPFLKVDRISFIYGQHDWMDPTGGIEVMGMVQQLKNNKNKMTVKETEPYDESHPDIEVYGVKNAGHLLMLENWQEFNAAMIMAMGRSRALPSNAQKPYKVLLDKDANGVYRYLKHSFFVKPRWERKEQNDKDITHMDDDKIGPSSATPPSLQS